MSDLTYPKGICENYMKERIGITSFQDRNVTTDSKRNKDLDEIKFGSTCNKLVSVKTDLDYNI